MMKVAFFTYPEWAFGSIHNALSKEFHRQGVIADIIDWNRNFSEWERYAIGELYDLFITTPGNSVTHLTQNFKIPYERIIAVAHGRYDLQHGLNEGNDFLKFRKLAGVSPDLAEFAKHLRIDRGMQVVRNGIQFDHFYQPVSTSLQTVGYGGAYKHLDFGNSQDIKRGYLVKELAKRTDLPFLPAEQQTYLTMPIYYSKVDCVIVSSTEESCGLPLMEAAASGRLPISTKVGVARDFSYFPGFTLPFIENDFLSQGTDLLESLKNKPKFYAEMCRAAQEYAREYYDWPRVIGPWLNLLN